MMQLICKVFWKCQIHMAVRFYIQQNNGNKGLQVWNDCKKILRIGFWHKSGKDLHAQIWNLQSITKNWQFCVKTSHTVYLVKKRLFPMSLSGLCALDRPLFPLSLSINGPHWSINTLLYIFPGIGGLCFRDDQNMEHQMNIVLWGVCKCILIEWMAGKYHKYHKCFLKMFLKNSQWNQNSSSKLKNWCIL